MIRFAFAQVLAHRLRLALTVVAVMLGVAFVTGSLVLNDTAQKLAIDALDRWIYDLGDEDHELRSQLREAKDSLSSSLPS